MKKNIKERIFNEVVKKIKLMKRDLVSRVKRIQMDPDSHMSTCVDEKTAPSKMVTSVVPATMSPIPKSERKNTFQISRIVV